MMRQTRADLTQIGTNFECRSDQVTSAYDALCHNAGVVRRSSSRWERSMPVGSPQDYHLHTRYSVDSRMPMEAACETAIELGVPEICFTEHVDLVPDDPDAGFFDPAPYFAELGRCRERFAGRLTIRAGAEFGESHRIRAQQDELTATYPFDFIIGSLHWVGSQSVMGLDYFEGRTRREAYEAYFAELLSLIREGDFDVLGHLDVPKRYEYPAHGRFDSAKFAEEIRGVLAACIARGVGIELNTGSMRRTEGDPSPSPEVLAWYRELGGEILTLGSDGHRPAHMAHNFSHALDMIRAAGFTHLTTFEGRKPRFVGIG
jgi:histidinol-phosphatase (PHP family)